MFEHKVNYWLSNEFYQIFDTYRVWSEDKGLALAAIVIDEMELWSRVLQKIFP